jgi:predicted dienelactone hydrolase
MALRMHSIVVLSLCLAAAFSCGRRGGPSLAWPQPTGPFVVGTMWFSFVDPDRPETFTADPNDQREIAVRVWYPADVGRSGERCLYAKRSGEPLGQGLSQDMRAALKRLDERISSVRTNAVKNARVASRGGPFPVVLYSHGYWAGMNQSTVLMEELASHGYVAASIGHSFETNSVTKPDGHVVLFDPHNPEFTLRGRERQAGLPIERAIVETSDPERIDSLFRELMKVRPKMLESLATWAADIVFAIDMLEELNRYDERFLGKLDLDDVGVVGHSFGGAASGQAALVDPRIGAGINMDGLQVGDMIDKDIGIPFVFMHHDNRQVLNPTPNINLFRRAKGPAYLVVIEGSGHYNFSDFSLPILSEVVPIPDGALGAIDGRRCIEILNRIVVTFFDVYLRNGDSAGLVEVFERYPEVGVLWN